MLALRDVERRTDRGADEPERPAVDEHDAGAYFAESGHAPGLEAHDLVRQAEEAEVDVAQRARNRIDPQRALDVDTAAPPIGRLEREPNLSWTRGIGGEAETVRCRECVVEQDVGVGSVEVLNARTVVHEASARELSRGMRRDERRRGRAARIDAHRLPNDASARRVDRSVEGQANEAGRRRVALYDAGEKAGPRLLEQGERGTAIGARRTARIRSHVDRFEERRQERHVDVDAHHGLAGRRQRHLARAKADPNHPKPACRCPWRAELAERAREAARHHDTVRVEEKHRGAGDRLAARAVTHRSDDALRGRGPRGKRGEGERGADDGRYTPPYHSYPRSLQ